MSMDWSNERYVRVYTRDTPEWLSLSFPAQGLFMALLRKVSRAGIMELGRLGRKGVFIAIGHAHQASMLEPALDELLADGCIQINGDTLVVPNFMDAQETPASDAQRAREHRARLRDGATRPKQNVTKPTGTPDPRDGSDTKRDAPETERDETVTPRHAASHGVTPNCAVPSVPSEKEHLRLAPLAAPPPKPKAKTGEDTLRRTLSDALVAVYAVERGGGYGFDSAKDGQALTRLLGWSRDVNEHSRRFRLALRAPAGDYSYRVDTIAAFATGRVWNHFASTGAQPGAATLTKLN